MPNVRVTSLALRLLKRLAKAGRRPMTAEFERLVVVETEAQQAQKPPKADEAVAS